MRSIKDIDADAVRLAVADLVTSTGYERWLLSAPDEALVRLAAPLEMLQFHYHLEPAQDRQLIRAARVCCDAAEPGLDGCAEDFVAAVSRLRMVLSGEELSHVL